MDFKFKILIFEMIIKSFITLLNFKLDFENIWKSIQKIIIINSSKFFFLKNNNNGNFGNWSNSKNDQISLDQKLIKNIFYSRFLKYKYTWLKLFMKIVRSLNIDLKMSRSLNSDYILNLGSEMFENRSKMYT